MSSNPSLGLIWRRSNRKCKICVGAPKVLDEKPWVVFQLDFPWVGIDEVKRQAHPHLASTEFPAAVGVCPREVCWPYVVYREKKRREYRVRGHAYASGACTLKGMKVLHLHARS